MTATVLDAHPSRLLALTAVPPWPSRDGYSVRAAHLLEEVSRYWGVTVISPGTDESRDVSAPNGINWIQLHELPATNILPWREERDLLVDAARKAIARDFDAALLWNGTEYVAEEIKGFPPAVGDRIDCETLQAWRSRKHRWWGFRRKLQELRRGYDQAVYERRVLSRLQGVVATTPEDARALERITGHSTVRVVTNGVDLPDLSGGPEEDTVPVVLFTGVLSFPPNIEAARYFATEVWPAVRKAVPEARFVIAGRTPEPEVERLASRAGVELRPNVPDMTAEIRRAWVTVAPMRSGGGIKNKVLEAWAAERPVVMSELAVMGLHLDDTLRETVATDEEEMVRAVVDLLSDEDARKRYGRAGRRRVAEHHTWESAVEPLEEMLEDATHAAAVLLR